jgi:cysteine desulfurase
MGLAAERAMRELKTATASMRELRDLLMKQIRTEIPDSKINTPAEAAPHVVNVSFKGVRGEVLVHALETHGIYVSTGSACSSREKIYSRVLKAMGLSEAQLEGSIRLSLSSATTREEIEKAVEHLKTSVADLRLFARR